MEIRLIRALLTLGEIKTAALKLQCETADLLIIYDDGLKTVVWTILYRNFSYLASLSIIETHIADMDNKDLLKARQATSACLEESVKKHLAPASESLTQMAAVISDGTKLLQQSFTELATKSEQQLNQLNVMLKQLKGGDIQSDTLMIERFARQIEKMIEEMASLEKINAAHAQENMSDMVKELMQANSYISGTIDSTSVIAKEIHQNVSTAVMAMQFEDSATQISSYIQSQLDNAKDSMQIMQQELLADTEITECLQRIEQRLQQLQTAEVHQAVTAKNMDAGDIDLF